VYLPSNIFSRDEDPLGTWTIRVNDQGEDGSSGAFLGWTMSLWGSTIEPSTAKQWSVLLAIRPLSFLTLHRSVPKLATVFPPLHPDEAENHPVASASLADAATSTKTYTNPTVVLGDNHTHAEGEAHRPAFSSAVSSSTSSATARPSSEGNWVSDTTAFVSDQKYLLAVVALLLVLVLIGGIVLQRKLAARRRRAQYASVAAEENVPLRSLDTRLRSAVSAPRDASAPEHMEDEDDADEETKLHGSERGPGYHSGFLDDEEMSPAAQTGPPSFYKDEPETDAHASDAR
jgi:kexin